MMTAKQDRARLLRMVAREIEAGRYMDAYELMTDADRMGRTQRWLLASAGLRIALHDAACGDVVDMENALAEARRAAS
jgi:hypothetical protein